MNIKKLTKNKKGFTIIEVVLVLAIAGLIFLMVFLAYPPLARNQRDTTRKDDMARFNTALSSYQSNNNGRVPADDDHWHQFVIDYLISNGDKFNDPDGFAPTDYPTAQAAVDEGRLGYSINLEENVNTHDPLTEFDHIIHVYVNATCNGESVAPSTGGGRKVAFQYKLEGGGTYCGNN